jgi:hypothetical protein
MIPLTTGQTTGADTRQGRPTRGKAQLFAPRSRALKILDIPTPNCLRLSIPTRPKRFLEIDLTLWGIVLYLSIYQANTLELTYEEKRK